MVICCWKTHGSHRHIAYLREHQHTKHSILCKQKSLPGHFILLKTTRNACQRRSRGVVLRLFSLSVKHGNTDGLDPKPLHPTFCFGFSLFSAFNTVSLNSIKLLYDSFIFTLHFWFGIMHRAKTIK